MYFLSVVVISSGLASKSRMRASKKTTVWTMGSLKCRPGLSAASPMGRPSWMTMARSVWSTVNADWVRTMAPRMMMAMRNMVFFFMSASLTAAPWGRVARGRAVGPAAGRGWIS